MPQNLSLWRWANARNVSFFTLYSGQFTFSTQLLTLNYFLYFATVAAPLWATVSLETYLLYSCARVSFILFPVAVRSSKTSLLEISSIGHHIRDICALCLANFIVEQTNCYVFFLHEYIYRKLSWSVLTGRVHVSILRLHMIFDR